MTSAAYAADPLLDIEFTWSDFGSKMKSKLGDLVQASLVFNAHPRLPEFTSSRTKDRICENKGVVSLYCRSRQLTHFGIIFSNEINSILFYIFRNEMRWDL